jgi:hypothetical protein
MITTPHEAYDLWCPHARGRRNIRGAAPATPGAAKGTPMTAEPDFFRIQKHRGYLIIPDAAITRGSTDRGCTVAEPDPADVDDWVVMVSMPSREFARFWIDAGCPDIDDPWWSHTDREPRPASIPLRKGRMAARPRPHTV